MNYEPYIERTFETLVSGDRHRVRRLVEEMDLAGISAEDRTHEIFWPVLEAIGRMFRSDQLAVLAHHYATRLLRRLIDENQAGYARAEASNRRVLVFCGATDVDEIAGQLVADLLEASGCEVWFGGGGVSNDEVLEAVGLHRPDVLLMFSSTGADAPNIRHLIDYVREIGSCPDMQFVVGGGVFNRAEGLAEEIGADLWVRTPRELVERLDVEHDRRMRPAQRTVGRKRRAEANAA